MSKSAMVKAMRSALRRADLNSITELVESGFPLDRLVFDEENRTALHVAVDLGRAKPIQHLLELGADPDVISDQFKETALHMACQEGDLKAVQLLLDGNANVNIHDEYGTTPLMAAAEASKNARQIVALLIESKATTAPNRNGRNPLHSTITDPEVVEHLVNAGADVNGKFHGVTPLMKAMENVFLCKIDPSSRAYNKPYPKVIAALIDHGADPRSEFPRKMRFGDDAKGQSILEYATMKKLPRAILDLLESGRASKPRRPLRKKK